MNLNDENDSRPEDDLKKHILGAPATAGPASWLSTVIYTVKAGVKGYLRLSTASEGWRKAYLRLSTVIYVDNRRREIPSAPPLAGPARGWSHTLRSQDLAHGLHNLA